MRYCISFDCLEIRRVAIHIDIELFFDPNPKCDKNKLLIEASFYEIVFSNKGACICIVDKVSQFVVA